MMPAALSRSPRSSHHLVLAALALAALALTALLWFHPTAGYAAEGSILAGADLRASLIVILWSALAVFAAVSTLVITLAARITPRRFAQLLAGYAAAVASMPLFAIVIDKLL